MSADHNMTAAKPYDEMHAADGTVRTHYLPYADWLERTARECITRKRKAGDADAAVDPLAEPEVKAAVARATFEVLVGFQLDQNQLAYNATR